MLATVRKFLADETAATTVEYGLVVALVAITALVGVGFLATSVNAMWGDNNSKIGEAMNSH